MIFEQVDERNGILLAYKYDFGVPVTFGAATDDIPFSVGDKILFELNTELKIQKEFTVNSEDFTFDLVFTKEEAEKMARSGKSAFVFSFKQLSSTGVFLDTIMNGKMVLKETLEWAE